MPRFSLRDLFWLTLVVTVAALARVRAARVLANAASASVKAFELQGGSPCQAIVASL